ncbi:ATP-binding protein [Candidatus Poribacteria bacterium]|nr:ATP-binding protein [Candidatus Poribacteria bacterium]
MRIRTLNYPFVTEAARILNAGVSKSLILHGNVQDLFFLPSQNAELRKASPASQDCVPREGQGGKEAKNFLALLPSCPLAPNPNSEFRIPNSGGDYVPLIPFLTTKWQVKGIIILVYELNGIVRFVNNADREKVKRAWVAWRTGYNANRSIQGLLDETERRDIMASIGEEFEKNLLDAIGNPTVALELLRQFTLCSRSKAANGSPFLEENLLILIEAADMLIPAGDGDISRLSQADRHRISIIQDWFSDPGFMNGDDSVVLITELKSLINQRVSKLPQVVTVEISSPDETARKHFISWFRRQQPKGKPLKLWCNQAEFATLTAGLSIHALRQILVEACYTRKKLAPKDVIAKVEEFIQSQLGEDVVEFEKPEHTLKDLVGFKRLIAFLEEELIPRFKATGSEALPGAVVCGPIGSGKTYIFEAVAGVLGIPVLTLKNIRSMWFGQTDVIFERLKRTLEALGKVLIFVDEADTQFGSIGPQAHETERRLTGKIQAMMSDPKLRGKVIWLLMTARIHLLSPDIRRPGRVGDLIIPVLDPEDEDRKEFLKWALKGIMDEGQACSEASPMPKAYGNGGACPPSTTPAEHQLEQLEQLTTGYSAASFASLRSELLAKAKGGKLAIEAVIEIVNDHLPPAIALARRYQTLQALVNCTRRSLLPDPNVTDEAREKWGAELRKLEAMGI